MQAGALLMKGLAAKMLHFKKAMVKLGKQISFNMITIDVSGKQASNFIRNACNDCTSSM